jgi:hypothetical protein
MSRERCLAPRPMPPMHECRAVGLSKGFGTEEFTPDEGNGG